MVETFLDTTGLMCPLPVLRARKVLKALPPLSTLKVVATDAASVMDFGVFCEQAGYELIEQSEDRGVFTFIIRRGQNQP